jgi:GT2 family glycosyltransferase
MTKTAIGIISYNDKHYLEKSLPILSELPNCKITILDNAENDEIRKFIEQKYPEIDYIRHTDGNLGFGRGHNYLALKTEPSDYYFCLNSDILLEPEGFNACIKHLDSHPDCCMVSAKLHYWDFAKNVKTNIIDTLGIVANQAHHFWDRGQGKEDKGQYDYSINNVFGISGAAFIIRRSCIPSLLGSSNQIFDENYFMYKEDIDLSYRMRWLGMDMQLLPNILGYHDRTVSKTSKKSLFEVQNSYRNHIIMLRNNFSKKYPFAFKYHTFLYEILKGLFYLFKNPKILAELKKAFKIKVRKSERKIRPKEMKKYFLK